MEVKNEKKVMFKDMIPIEMHAIVSSGKSGREFFNGNTRKWERDDRDDIQIDLVYRAIKTITPNELYKRVDEYCNIAPSRAMPSDILLPLIGRLDGFNDGGES